MLKIRTFLDINIYFVYNCVKDKNSIKKGYFMITGNRVIIKGVTKDSSKEIYKWVNIEELRSLWNKEEKLMIQAITVPKTVALAAPITFKAGKPKCPLINK